MMMVAKAVTTGHHWGSFQSVQKSQSPANSSRVISAAPATTKIAVIQKTASQERSIHCYFALSRSRNASLRCLSAAAAAAIDGAVAMLPLARSSGQECQDLTRAAARIASRRQPYASGFPPPRALSFLSGRGEEWFRPTLRTSRPPAIRK